MNVSTYSELERTFEGWLKKSEFSTSLKIMSDTKNTIFIDLNGCFPDKRYVSISSNSHDDSYNLSATNRSAKININMEDDATAIDHTTVTIDLRMGLFELCISPRQKPVILRWFQHIENDDDRTSTNNILCKIVLLLFVITVCFMLSSWNYYVRINTLTNAFEMMRKKVLSTTTEYDDEF